MNRQRIVLGRSAALLVAFLSAASASAQSATDTQAVRDVLGRYRAAVEKLDAHGTERLFVTDSRVFGSGGAEGTDANDLAHHLGPELAEFRVFKFRDYTVDARFEGPVALATETDRYRIEPKQGEVAERLGVQTSVLRPDGETWRIVTLHTSSRRPK